MPNDLSKTPNSNVQQVVDRLTPRFEVLPGEDGRLFEGFRDDMMRDLAPASTYAQVLAERLIGLEWELHRHRAMRDGHVRAALVPQLEKAIERRLIENGEVYEGDTTPASIANDLVHGTRQERQAAREEIAELHLDETAILALAHDDAHQMTLRHEIKIQNLEARSREAWDDFERIQNRLKPALEATIEDAEIVSDDD